MLFFKQRFSVLVKEGMKLGESTLYRLPVLFDTFRGAGHLIMSQMLLKTDILQHLKI